MLFAKYCSYCYKMNTGLERNRSESFRSFLDSMSKGSLRSKSSCTTYSFSNFNLEEDSKALDKKILTYSSSSEGGGACKEIFNNDGEDGYVPNKGRPIQMERSKFKDDLGLDENPFEEEQYLENTSDSDAEFDEWIYENEQIVNEEEHSTSVSVFSRSSMASEHQRAKPENPRLGLGETTLDDLAKKVKDRIKRTKSEIGSKPTSLFTTQEKACFKRTTPDLRKISSEKWPLLHLLVTSGQEFYLDRYLKQGVDVNVIDKDGYSALQRAVIAKKEAATSMLLREGADAMVCDKDGATLLHYSVQTGSINLVRSLIRCGIDVNSADMNGWTALHLAVVTGRADIVQLLLVSGADKTIMNKDGLTPLEICLSLGRIFNSSDVAVTLKTYPKKKASIGI